MSQRVTAGTIRRIMAVPESEELARVIEEVGDHVHGAKLSEIATRVLLDRAEGLGEHLDTDPGLAEKLAKESKLEREERLLDGADPFEELQRGPTSTKRAALLGALLARGIAIQLEEAKDESATKDAVSGLLERLDWLEATTALSPYETLTAILESHTAEVFWRTVAQDLVHTSRQSQPESPNVVARQQYGLLARASALTHAPKKVKRTLATNVLADLESSVLKRVALAAIAGVDDTENRANKSEHEQREVVGARAASAARIPELKGELERRPWSGTARLLAAVTGVLLIRWLYRLGARYLMGWRREASIKVTVNTVTVEEKVHLLGRVIREGTTTHSLRSLRNGAVERRFRYLHLLVGALGLVLLMTVGVNFLVEGACSGYSPLALFGLAIIGGGILLDVLLEVLIPGKKSVSTVTLDFGRRKLVRLRHIDKALATSFIAKLERLVPAPKKR